MAEPLAAHRRDALQTLLRDARLWRGDGAAPLRTASTGHAALDALLPGAGWPRGALSEIVYPASGVGELRLAMPLLARLTQAGRTVALIAPPHRPYAPALHQHGVALEQLVVIDARAANDALWAAEELLRAHAGAVLLWQDELDDPVQRRLQLAAEQGDGCMLVYRRARHRDSASVAALRMQLTHNARRTEIEVLKCRGARPRQRVALA